MGGNGQDADARLGGAHDDRALLGEFDRIPERALAVVDAPAASLRASRPED